MWHSWYWYLDDPVTPFFQLHPLSAGDFVLVPFAIQVERTTSSKNVFKLDLGVQISERNEYVIVGVTTRMCTPKRP